MKTTDRDDVRCSVEASNCVVFICIKLGVIPDTLCSKPDTTVSVT